MQELFDAESPKPPKISRRTFLRGAGAMAATGLVGVTLPSGVDYAQEKIIPEELKEEIKKKAEFLKSKYDIPIGGTFLESKNLKELHKVFDEFKDTQYKDASLAKINRALEYLIQEFSKYPVFFIKNLHIPSINIVDSLVAEGNSTTTGSTSRKESGLENYIILEISGGTLDKDKNFGWSEKQPFKKTIHHELFHVIFHAADNSSRHIFSREWVSLYDPEDYGTKPYKGKPGFISDYGQEDSSEDFPETASAMMNNSENIFNKIKEDKKLKRKVDFLKQVIFQKSLGLIDRAYWDFSGRGELPSDFFQKRKAYLLSLDSDKFQQELKSNNWTHSMIGDGEVDFRKKLAEMEV